jgi:hypothetical protein
MTTEEPRATFNCVTGAPILDHSGYRKLASILLGADLEQAPLPTITVDNVNDPIRTNPGDLTDADDQRLAAKVCQLANGMNAVEWNRLSEDQRIPWMKEAIATLTMQNVDHEVRSDTAQASQGTMSRCSTLADLALRVDELLLPPAVMAVARQLVEACLADPVQGNVDAFRFPENPDDPCDWNESSFEADVALTPGQTAVALAALHDVYCGGVEKVVPLPAKFAEDATPADWKRALRWTVILDRVRKLGDYALRWFTLLLRRFERILTAAKDRLANPLVAGGPSLPSAVEVFFSYSHKDKKLRDKLDAHLSQLKHDGLISDWHDHMIGAGTEWEGQINHHLNSARIILLLISADFLASRYCYDVEMKRAMERHDAGQARVIPVILKPCDWHGALFGKLEALPEKGRPVTEWRNKDKALTDVARGIRDAVKALVARQ